MASRNKIGINSQLNLFMRHHRFPPTWIYLMCCLLVRLTSTKDTPIRNQTSKTSFHNNQLNNTLILQYKAKIAALPKYLKPIHQSIHWESFFRLWMSSFNYLINTLILTQRISLSSFALRSMTRIILSLISAIINRSEKLLSVNLFKN